MPDPSTTPIITQSPSNKLVALRLTVLMIKTAGAYIVGSLTAANWSGMSGQEKFIIVTAGIVALATNLESFYDKTSANAAQGKAAIASGNTPPPFPAAVTPQPPPTPSP